MSKATERPWIISSSTLVCSKDAKIIAQCANIEPIGVKFDEATANAQLIIQAVNSFNPQYVEALEKVMEAARIVSKGTRCDDHCVELADDKIECIHIKLSQALANPALRNHKQKGQP